MITQKAFTLIETLVVIAILGIVGMILADTFTRSLGGGNKAEVLALLKQNGQAALESMDKKIRDSDQVVCADVDGNLVVVEKGGSYTRYRFANNHITHEEIVLPRPQDVFLIDICTDAPYTTNVPPVKLTDPAKVIVEVPSGGKIFKVSRPTGFKAIVTVNFFLKPNSLIIPQAISGIIDPVQFTTTIQLRN